MDWAIAIVEALVLPRGGGIIVVLAIVGYILIALDVRRGPFGEDNATKRNGTVTDPFPCTHFWYSWTNHRH